MTRTILTVCAASLLSTPLLVAQQPPAAAERRLTEVAAQAAGMARASVETRVTRDKPYAAEAVTEFVQILGDGNRIVRKSSARLFRDSEGRTRREELGDSGDQERSSVVITDPLAGSSFVLNPAARTATKLPAMFARVEGGTISMQPSSSVTVTRTESQPKVEVIAVPAASGRGGAPQVEWTAGTQATTFAMSGGRMMITGAVGGETTKEDLGQQTIEGVTATGTRTTTVIPAGAMGNEQPITVLSEQWFSADLGVLVMTRHSDPRVGDTTYRLLGISRNEPDRALFQVPSDYTVQDRAPVRLRQKQQQ